ncbi:MAG TPA: winged helix-turn-helix domain-containing protein [Thermoplasmata archaeon]|nr:winged helix-turn-helix domain-containing protein [Thermoplasmata archaeon]
MSPAFRSLMWYLLAGTRGGPNRRRILEQLHDGPANAHQLATELDLDYRTVRHHLLLLEKNGAIARPLPDAYAPPYELAPYLAAHFEIVAELGRATRRPAVPTARRAPIATPTDPALRRGAAG